MVKPKEKKNHSSKPTLDSDQGKSLAKLTGITFEVLSLNLIIIAGGYYLDTWFPMSFPVGMLSSIFLSIAATIFYLLKKLNT